MFRLAALVIAGLCIQAALDAWGIGLKTGSLAARGAAIAVGVVGLWSGLSALAPVLISGPLRRVGPLVRLWKGLQRQEEASSSIPLAFQRRMVGLSAALVAWGCVCFAANVFGNALGPIPVSVDDQGAYLERARQIQDPNGSFFTLPRLFNDLRSGRFREDNRHPLYLGLLAIDPREEWGRTLSWTFGIAAFVTGIWMVWRRFSPLAAGIFAIAAGINHNLGEFSVMVVCETLLIWLVSLSYFVLLPPLSASRSLGRKRFRVLTASALLGLAWMTKGTGLVFYAVFLVWLAWQCRPRREDEIPAAVEEQAVISLVEAYPVRQWILAMICGVVGFAVVSAPLIERNTRVFGNPFHNVNSLLLFADDYSEFDNMLKGEVTPGEAAEEYWRTHTVGQMVDRELHGLVWEAFIMLLTLGPQGLDDGRVLFGAPLAVCCVIGLWFERRPAKWLLAGWVFASWVMFAWYVPIAAGDRFPIPLLLPVLGHAADGLARIVRILRMPLTDEPVAAIELPSESGTRLVDDP